MRTMPTPIRYHFNQSFIVSAKEAYLWCTDFTPQDHKLLDENNAEREVVHLADSTLILKETFHTSSGIIEKQKLVQLYPERFSWVSTHLTGPNMYSQFIYEISEKGADISCLDFTALHLEYREKKLGAKEAKVLAAKLCEYDSKVWKLLAKALEKELKK